MARPLRIQYSGALYHITSRGNAGQKIYNSRNDYLLFLDELKNVIDNHNWISYAYCLMPNHYHLFIKTLDPNLSIGLRQLNGNYAQGSNIRLGRYGHLFQGRFKSILVESEAYQGNLVRYITLNPVRAKLVKTLADWPWSSHREIMGKAEPSGCVHPSETLKFFHADRNRAREEYVKYLKERCDYEETWGDLRSGLILGSTEFARSIIEKYGDNKSDENIKKERFAGRPVLENIFSIDNNKDRRNRLILKAFRKYGYTQTEIGKHLDLHYSTISRILERKGEIDSK